MGERADTRTRATAERMPGVRSIARPLPDGSGSFELGYVRTGPRGGPTVLVVPGGPGLASVLPYVVLRALAAAKGMDVLMVEHRGIGLSRRAGDVDLPRAALTIEATVEDLAAVLDAEGVDRVVAFGSSYGTYLVQGLGLRHPERIAGMVLDSPMRSARDLDTVRRHLRSVLWDGIEGTTRSAALLRELVAAGIVDVQETGAVVPVVYEAGGARLLERLLGALRRGRGGRATWEWVRGLAADEVHGTAEAYTLETDLVGRIAYCELDYGAPPDGLPLDPQVVFTAGAERYPAFTGEPFDLVAAASGFTWPTAVMSGGRDIRTPRPVAAALVADLPDGVLVPLADSGHSALDTHALAAVHVAGAVATGHHDRLPRLADRIDALPRRGNGSHWLGRVLAARLAADVALGR